MLMLLLLLARKGERAQDAQLASAQATQSRLPENLQLELGRKTPSSELANTNAAPSGRPYSNHVFRQARKSTCNKKFDQLI